MKSASQQLFEMLKACLRSEPYDMSDTDRQMLAELFCLSKKHDLAHMVAHTLHQQNVTVPEELEKEWLTAIYRQTQLDAETEKVCALLSELQIPHIPLKGAVIRSFYPERWMRTSCDIDILIPRKRIKQARKALVKRLRYQRKTSDYHDVSLYAPSGVHLELHFSICEDQERMDRVLTTVWEHAHPSASDPFLYEMEESFFLFHMVAHAAYHFQGGGCGIRPLIDLWVLRERLHPDLLEFRSLLEKARLEAFYNAVMHLIRVWFDGETHTELTMQMEAYILQNGVYGTMEQSVSNACMQSESRFRYLLRRLFPPFRQMRVRYPAVSACPPLIVPFWVVRIVSGLCNGRLLARMPEVQISKQTDGATVQKTMSMLKQLDLLRF